MQSVKELRMALERKKGERDGIDKVIKDAEGRIKKYEAEVDYSSQAQAIIQAVGRETQKQLEFRVAELVSLALSSVFDDPWALKLQFVLRRGRTECDLHWTKSDGRESSDIRYGGGGGEGDVAALGLQFAMWSLQRPKTRSTMLLDEPARFLKGGNLPERGAAMIREISKGLKLQIIMVSHQTEQISSADKIFEVVKDREGVSHVSVKSRM